MIVVDLPDVAAMVEIVGHLHATLGRDAEPTRRHAQQLDGVQRRRPLILVLLGGERAKVGASAVLERDGPFNYC